MIVGLGMDVCELSRIEVVYERHGERFLQKILTEAERAALPAKPLPYLASRFAAKEAASKALGTGFRDGLWFTDIEVTAGALGKPSLLLTGKARERAAELGVTHIHVTLTHGRDVAAAVVVLEAP